MLGAPSLAILSRSHPSGSTAEPQLPWVRKASANPVQIQKLMIFGFGLTRCPWKYKVALHNPSAARDPWQTSFAGRNCIIVLLLQLLQAEISRTCGPLPPSRPSCSLEFLRHMMTARRLLRPDLPTIVSSSLFRMRISSGTGSRRRQAPWL